MNIPVSVLLFILFIHFYADDSIKYMGLPSQRILLPEFQSPFEQLYPCNCSLLG